MIPPNRPAESHRRVRRFTIGNRELEGAHFYENLAVADDVEVVATWSNRYAEGVPMATSRKVGKGRVLYLGTYLTADLTAALADRTFTDAGVEPLIADLPDGVEVTMRQNDERHLLFVQNYTDQHAELTNVPHGVNLLDGGKSVSGALLLEAYGCAIVELG